MAASLEDAWDELHDAKPPGWFIGRQYYNERLRAWRRLPRRLATPR